MAVPEGALPRAALVAVPLSLIVLIFVTPTLFGPEGQPSLEDIPYFLVQVTGEEWNATVNQTGLLYVRSPLGVSVYRYIAINVSGIDAGTNLTGSCGGTAAFVDRNWTCGSAGIPSMWMKFPVVDDSAVNASAVAVWEDRTFAYNATVAFGWGPQDWTVRLWPGQDIDAAFSDYVNVFQERMQEEAG